MITKESVHLTVEHIEKYAQVIIDDAEVNLQHMSNKEKLIAYKNLTNMHHKVWNILLIKLREVINMPNYKCDKCDHTESRDGFDLDGVKCPACSEGKLEEMEDNDDN